MSRKIIVLFLFSLSLYAQVIGEVSLLRGSAFLVDDKGEQVSELKQEDSVSVLDTVSVSDKSFVKLKMKDGSILMFPGNSLMKLEKYQIVDGKRDSVVNLIKGKIRAQIQNFENEQGFVVKTKMSSIGVRGTEFLVSSYAVAEKSVTDTVLLTGKVNAEVLGATAVDLAPGQALNSTEYIASGKVRFISKESLSKLIVNSEAFLPNIQLPNGSFIDLDSEIKNIKTDPTKTSVKETVKKAATPKSTATTATTSSTSTTATTTASSAATTKALAAPSAPGGGGSGSLISSASTGTGGTGAASAPMPASGGLSVPSVPELSKATAVKSAVKKSIQYITATAWDIKDALVHRTKRKRVNECFYWYFDISSDGLTHERFREEKDCDEFEFDDFELK